MTVPLRTLQNPEDDPRVPPLGRRWRDYTPDKSDFALYRARCADLLCITRLRRALRCGGILWRIAMDFLECYQGMDGPMVGTLNEAMVLKSSSGEPLDLVEDGLSQEEVGLLIGAFESRDEKGKHEPVFYSFWPPPWVWDASGYNLGYWAPDCEDWYVHKLEDYREGKGAHKLQNATQWMNKLRRFKDTTHIADTLEIQWRKIIAGNVLV
ncbi:hypothetical protein SCHPADRAFT_836413 [Schizopora paradoxa]|uniref:Uncharacterized protein n=1 Tax=Schizopora paradoxa TaxID=27342 RepID=A0A0H2RS06_9AGAM|nr:hypothetical protein SCHPADRAFT_836413 [Schizopora paradoxa]